MVKFHNSDLWIAWMVIFCMEGKLYDTWKRSLCANYKLKAPGRLMIPLLLLLLILILLIIMWLFCNLDKSPWPYMSITGIKTDLEPLEPGIELSLGLCLSKSHMIPALLNTLCLDHADKSPALQKNKKIIKKRLFRLLLVAIPTEHFWPCTSYPYAHCLVFLVATLHNPRSDFLLPPHTRPFFWPLIHFKAWYSSVCVLK